MLKMCKSENLKVEGLLEAEERTTFIWNFKKEGLRELWIYLAPNMKWQATLFRYFILLRYKNSNNNNNNNNNNNTYFMEQSPSW